jgi:serine/threonine protein kinase
MQHRIISQILGAVFHMHRRGIVHRDIKPENVLFDMPGEDLPVRIVDFDLSQRHGANVAQLMSSLAATLYYIAPEVLLRRYDRSCSLWLVGVIVYILLCCYLPFLVTTDHQTHELVLRGQYNFYATDWNNISAEAMEYVQGLLWTDPCQCMTIQWSLSHPWIVR